jgi:ribosome biogenesis GTPase
MEEAQSSDIAAIGDRVTIALSERGHGTIESVEPRRTVISRAVRTDGARGAGAPEREQVIVANVDQAFFVFAAASPAPNTRALDRFLVMGEKANIDRITVVLNKIDLVTDGELDAVFSPYKAIGFGIDELRARLTGHLSVFTGPSGVGKTSLLNCIQPGLGRSVRAVSARNQEGMHTTRDSALIRLADGGYVADTPGIRTLSMWDVEPEELDGYFREIAERVPHCRFRDCAHRTEPGCAVREAVNSGQISVRRYKSYLLLRAELEEMYTLT